MSLYSLVRPALFRIAPEAAHDLSLSALAWAKHCPLPLTNTPEAPSTLWGFSLPNPIGLAAGLDKNGDYIDALGRLGFGFLEVGTITPRAQAGNPKPRLFRITQEQALINRMGFNNKGVAHLVQRLRKRRFTGLLGVNIGKNKDTPNERAAEDYITCLNQVYPYADYITVNLSSPNTPGLRDLQAPDALSQLLGKIQQARLQAANQHNKHCPLVVKVAPDLNADDISATAEVLAHHQIDGVIATNTTLQRPQVDTHPAGQQSGGLSGAPLKPLADEALQRFHRALPTTITRIGCGGVVSGADAADKFHCGAQAVQIYTGLIYRGPALISEAAQALAPLIHPSSKPSARS